ncbi:MAG: C25 family cysteine peptidase [bacterium]
MITKNIISKYYIIAALALLTATAARAEGGFRIKDLRSVKNGADYIVVTPKQFMEDLKPLLEKRAADGLRVAAVTPEQIYKDFDRWPAGPKAIREFVRYAYFNWKQPGPRFLLLNGDINVYEKYDPAGVMVPTFMVKMTGGDGASDNPYGDVNGDEIPEIAVGRFPTDNAEQLKAMVSKVIAYETTAPPGPWRRRITGFASTGDFGLFDSTLEEITRRIMKNNFDPAFDMSMTYGGSYLPYFMLPDEFGKKVIERFNEGALIMTYIGHGGVTGLSNVCWKDKCSDIMETEDITKIDSGGKNSFFFSTCCLTGKFNITTECIAEEMMKLPLGPVGVFAASKDSSPYSNALLSKDYLYFLVKNRPVTIGEGLLNVKRGLIKRFDEDRKSLDKQYKLVESRESIVRDGYDHVYMYNYFGDPATRIAYPEQNITIAAPAKAKAGDTIEVSVQAKEKKAGKLLVTLECFPTEVIHEVVSIDGLTGEKLAAAVKKNYAAANDKTAARVETMLGADGAAGVKIKIPETLSKGAYFVKAYAWEGAPDSMGIVAMEIENDKLRQIEEKKETKSRNSSDEKASAVDALIEAIDTMKEPDTGKYEKAEALRRKNEKQPVEIFDSWEERMNNQKEKFATALKLNPNDAEALVGMADVYEWENQPDMALETIEKAKAEKPDPKILVPAARIYMKLNRYEDAERIARAAVEADNGNAGACQILSDLLRTTGRFEEAIKVLEDCKTSGREAYMIHIALANIFDQLGRNDKKEEAYFAAMKFDSSDLFVKYDLFYLYLWGKRDNEAAEKAAREIIDKQIGKNWMSMFKELAQLAFRNDAAGKKEYFKLMWQYYKLKKDPYPKAMAVASLGNFFKNRMRDGKTGDKLIEKAMTISPKCAGCLTFNSMPRNNSDAGLCERALKIDPDFVDGNACLGFSSVQKLKYEEAAKYYEKARTADPKRQIFNEEIISLIKTGNKEKALQIMNEPGLLPMYDSGNREENVILTLMRAYEAAKDYDGARDEYELYVKKFPYGVMGHHIMANIYYNQDKCELAAKLEKKAIANDSYCGDCLINLGNYSLRIKQYKDAENAYKSANKITPRNGSVLAMLGKTYLEAGDKDEARKMFKEALDLDKWNSVAYEGIQKLIDPGIYMD